jgi:hypothetical protein
MFAGVVEMKSWMREVIRTLRTAHNRPEAYFLLLYTRGSIRQSSLRLT